LLGFLFASTFGINQDLFLQQETAAAQGHAEIVDYVDPAIAQNSSMVETQNALKFNLLPQDEFEGYTISIGPNKVQLLHRIVTETGLFQCDAPTICRYILYDSKPRQHPNLTRKTFQAAMKRVFDYTFKKLSAPMSDSSQEELSRFTDVVFDAFDRLKAGKVNALALACGFTMLCGGRKSDKLEHVFELLDEDKDSLVSRQDITRFIQSFLVMLMSISSSLTHIHGGGVCSNDNISLSRAIDAGSEWATSQVFNALQPKNDTMSFDDFADWYTKGGYQTMPWLELLDLRKWVLGS
jgi:Ca2+-binding EF-hand superfamily protein